MLVLVLEVVLEVVLVSIPPDSEQGQGFDGLLVLLVKLVFQPQWLFR